MIFLSAAAAVAVASVAVFGFQAWRAAAPQFAGTPASSPIAPAPSPTAPPPPQASSAPPAVDSTPASRAGAGAGGTAASSSAPEPAPSFDIVRVEPTGEAVVAGRAAPNARVALLDAGKPVAAAQADAGGQFALTPRFAPGEHQLSLDSGAEGGASRQSVTVVVPKGPTDRLVVALAEPGRPTKVLSDQGPSVGAPASSPQMSAPQASAPGTAGAQPPADRVFIRTLEADQEGGFFAAGAASPGAQLRIYLNNSSIAAVRADSSGAWSLKVDRGLTPGAYEVRADQLGPDGVTVTARAEAAFDFAGFAPHAGAAPAASGSGNATAGAAPAVGTAQGTGEGAVEVADLSTVRVTEGENLWVISRRIFGRGIRYTLIYEANAGQIRDKNLIYPGQVFVVPKN